MPIYRAYAQPDNPAVYRVLGLEALEEDVKYTRELKTACLLAAGPQPTAPHTCPRCYQPSTFESRLCYKYGIAGAWNMFCHKCRQVHIPTQVGPKENDLEGIEAIRDRDRQAHRARKDAKARARETKKKTKTKKPTKPGALNGAGRNDLEAVAARPRIQHVEEQRPFGIIGNAMAQPVKTPYTHLTDNKNQSAATAIQSEHAAEVHRVPHSVAGQHDHVQRNRPKPRRVDSSASDEDVRTILLVLWEKPGQPPFVDRVVIPSRDELFLFHHPHVRAIPAPTQFERYVFVGNIWSPVPWDITRIEVAPDDRIIFVRVMGITCRGFGQQFHNYQLDRGDALPSRQRLAHIIYKPPKDHRWVIVWHQDRVPPTVFLFDLTLLDNEEDGKRVPRPWLELLRDAPFYLIWHEVQTRWRGIIGKQSPQLVNAPMYLFADPRVDHRLGSGEAIAWLDSWRAEHPLDDTAADGSDGSSERAPSTSSTNRNPPTRTYGKKRGAPVPIEARALSISDDEPSSVPDSSTTSTCAKGVKRARTSRRSAISVIDISDDDAEFVQGSSSSPMKANARARDIAAQKPGAAREIIDLTAC